MHRKFELFCIVNLKSKGKLFGICLLKNFPFLWTIIMSVSITTNEFLQEYIDKDSKMKVALDLALLPYNNQEPVQAVTSWKAGDCVEYSTVLSCNFVYNKSVLAKLLFFFITVWTYLLSLGRNHPQYNDHIKINVEYSKSIYVLIPPEPKSGLNNVCTVYLYVIVIIWSSNSSLIVGQSVKNQQGFSSL